MTASAWEQLPNLTKHRDPIDKQVNFLSWVSMKNCLSHFVSVSWLFETKTCKINLQEVTHMHYNLYPVYIYQYTDRQCFWCTPQNMYFLTRRLIVGWVLISFLWRVFKKMFIEKHFKFKELWEKWRLVRKFTVTKHLTRSLCWFSMLAC